VILSGCGFRPSYGLYSVDPDILSELSSISVDPLRDRLGQLISNSLLADLRSNSNSAKNRYHLNILIQQSTNQIAISSDQTSTREAQNYSITFRLYEGDKAIVAGTFVKIFTINLLQSNYSNEISIENNRLRAAQEISSEIRNRLIAYFSKASEMRHNEMIKQASQQNQIDNKDSPKN
jgi:LPS-assembly lipoprotein